MPNFFSKYRHTYELGLRSWALMTEIAKQLKHTVYVARFVAYVALPVTVAYMYSLFYM